MWRFKIIFKARRIWGLGCRVLGFWVVGFGVWGFRVLEVSGSGLGLWGSGFRIYTQRARYLLIKEYLNPT